MKKAKERLIEICHAILDDGGCFYSEFDSDEASEKLADAISKEFKLKKPMTATEMVMLEEAAEEARKALPYRLKKLGYIPIKDAPKYCEYYCHKYWDWRPAKNEIDGEWEVRVDPKYEKQ